MTKYWVAAISKEHTQRGASGNFIQVCHGKQAPLKRMKKGDYLIVYSSKITMEGNEKHQKFTAAGQVMDDEVYPFRFGFFEIKENDFNLIASKMLKDEKVGQYL